MSVDLNTYGSNLRKAVDSVFDGIKSWVIFTYKGTNYALDVECDGTSREDMFDNFSTSQIMYGFTRIDDPVSTGLSKYIFIFWQGEGAPKKLKIICSQHLSAIKNICRTVHLTVTAHNESDLDWNEIDCKVRQSSFFGRSAPAHLTNAVKLSPPPEPSHYKKVNPPNEIEIAKNMSKATISDDVGDTNGNVGTNWKRVDPGAELKAFTSVSRNRQQFQQQQPRQNVGTAYQKVDIQAEMRAAQQQQQQHNQKSNNQLTNMVVTQQQQQQQYQPKSNSNGTPANAKLPANSLSAVLSSNGDTAKAGKQAAFPAGMGPGHPVQTNWPSVAAPLPPLANSVALQPPVENTATEPARADQSRLTDRQSADQQDVSVPANSLTAVCLYDFTANEPDELSFHEGDRIFEIQQIDAGWWIGSTADGHTGLFPANHVKLLPVA